MPYAMKDLRLTKLSIIYYLVSGLSVRGWFNQFSSLSQNIIDSFPEDPRSLNSFPTISVGLSSNNISSFQLGAGRENVNRFNITSYCDSDGVSDDLAHDIGNIFFEARVDLKNYNQGFPPPFGSSSEPTISGYIYCDSVLLIPKQSGVLNMNANRYVTDIFFNARTYLDY